MHFSIVSLFPDFFSCSLKEGLMGRAQEKEILSYSLHNPRDYSQDKHHKVDDRPYGGGPGMVMLADPLARCLDDILEKSNLYEKKTRIIYLSPKGKALDQKLAAEFATEEHLVLICGRYEGIDQRIEDLYEVESISVGDFVLNGGEAAALCVMESSARLLPHFMGDAESGIEESFSHGLLEYPHYTRPEVFRGLSVPAVLSSGNHAAIAQWRREESLSRTLQERPELLNGAILSKKDATYLKEQEHQSLSKNLYYSLVHYPVLDKYKKTVAVSLTNLDIHDIARSCCTYGLAAYYIVSPIEDQQRLLEQIVGHWKSGPTHGNTTGRDQALGLVRGVYSLEEAMASIEKERGQRPLLIGSTARFERLEDKGISFQDMRKILENNCALFIAGTGHGLSPEVQNMCDYFLPPIRWGAKYNHLSVRSATAILLDRMLGDWF